jgi:hypothetical protein
MREGLIIHRNVERGVVVKPQTLRRANVCILDYCARDAVQTSSANGLVYNDKVQPATRPVNSRRT